MKLRIIILGLGLVLLAPLASRAQAVDNMLYAKQFPGKDVGTKIGNAMKACNPDALTQCFIVLDPSLIEYNAGTVPPLCLHCYLVDWRIGPPIYKGGVTWPPLLTGSVGTVPPVSSLTNGMLVVIQDGLNATDCSVGGGTFANVCVVTSGSLVPVGGTGLAIPGLSSDSANGINVRGNINAGSLGNVLSAGTVQFPTIASAVTALPSTGGTVITPPMYTETITNLALGSSSKPVSLFLGQGSNLTVTGSTGIQVFNGSSIQCQSASPAACTITSSPSGSADQVITNGQQNGTQEYFNLKGIFVRCSSAVAYTNGCVYVNGVFVPSGIEDSIISGFANSIGLHITSTASTNGGTNVFFLKNNWINGGNSTGAAPVVLDVSGSGTLSAVTVVGGAIENPGVGQHALTVNGNGGSAALHGIGIYSTQVQNNPSNTVSGVYISDVETVKISNMLFNAQPTGFPCVELNQTISSGLGAVDADTVRCSNFASTPVIKNDVTGYQTTSGKYQEVHYFYSGGTHTQPTMFDGSVQFSTTNAQQGTTDTVACPNNTTANFATTYSIPANTIGSSTLLRVIMTGTVASSASSVPTMAVRLNLGGTQVWTAASVAPGTSFASVPWSASLLIRGTAAFGPAVPVLTNLGSSSAYPPVDPRINNTISQNLATNGALTVQPVLFCSANTAGNSATLNQLSVETLVP